MLPWRLRQLSVCASTEDELSRWLAAGGQGPLAVIARRQSYGRGQHGRRWQSPPGGLWISAALPWTAAVPPPPKLPRLMAQALADELAPLALPLTIKDPNDLMLDGRKLAGILSAVVWRGGQARQLRFGIGLNGRHPMTAPAVSLQDRLGSRCPPWPDLVLLGLHALERCGRTAAGS
jgi:BirA family biotin operon repressor/biotin-[acetyl-CoA-carboxylase] ligase